MIVKNEAGNIIPCIHPLRSVLDEIVVIDTGSSDSTQEIARQLGAKVFDFKWCDDFSAARNESIRQATGDYILWLDADDRVDPPEVKKIESLKKMFPPQKDQAYYVMVNNQSPVDGETRFYQLRIFPRVEGVRFEGRVHEQIFQTLRRQGIKLIQTDIIIRHIGYSDPKTMLKKSERNLHIIEEELKENPDNPLLHYNAARTLAGMNRQVEAISHMRKIIEDQTLRERERFLYIEASLLMGKYYVELGRYEEAIFIFEEVLSHFKGNSLIHFCLGEALFLAGDFERAKEELTRSIGMEIEVSFFPINIDRLRYYQYFRLGQCYWKMGRMDSAQEMFLISLKLHKDHSQSLEALALLNLEGERFKEAAEYYEKAIQEGAESDQNYSNLGLALWKMGSWIEAEKALKKALEINPRRLEALTNLGHLYHAKHEELKAIDCFNEALIQAPDLKDVRLGLSEIYFKKYDLENLVEQCDTLLEVLNLPRDRVVSSFEDLGWLYKEIGDRICEHGALPLSLMAYHTSFLIYPTEEVLDQILSTAKLTGGLESSIRKVEESLAFHKQQGPHPLSLKILHQT